MSRVVVLDAGPIGLVTNPKLSPESTLCTRWLQTLITSNIRVIIPEIADYEVRRELLRANKVRGIARLDELANLVEYLPITTVAMRQAAMFWAQARQQGQPTAGDKTIDSDMILAAQAMTLDVVDVVIATTNVGHLSRFATADLWQNINLG
ncbi:MAG: nuclease [Microcoleus sp. PH2017_01_SCD_O_A]|uniref:nuclease n=1 Tax=unclassified Microcoleus TaxID=2642155 RepID=UPI001D7C06BD|nr:MULTISPECIES: nuclease [unclassified Microcoleus]MCC3422604.1 nuclease [Microcoleus sp. PH2017_01_SCD_O_A]MCC3446255.1 nuclease [Microcoleus sp. PH2017_09_SFU_O_A]MCC3489360.1 nuclease [Microcoleus sp. PH2017_16_JOR_D_A]MCC3570735.1 nuclease [Microcoleus sp. PH2017_34_RAT_O_A]MCC3608282.1 nuclease [Microcoleus sp. PH2017_40_RAT_O_B]